MQTKTFPLVKLKQQFRNTINICMNAKASMAENSDRALTKTVTRTMNAMCVSHMRLFSLNILMIVFNQRAHSGMMLKKHS